MSESTIKFLHTWEKERLFKTISMDQSRYHIRNKAIFYIAEYGGLRASEIGLLKVTDFNIYKREIYIRRLKNSRPNTLRILDPEVYQAMVDYIAYRNEEGITDPVLFVSQKGTPLSRKSLHLLMKKYCAAAGISPEKAHFHALKHTRAVELADLGFDTKEVQYWIGHKSIKNTEIYLQFTSKQQETLYQKYLLLMEENKTIECTLRERSIVLNKNYLIKR